MIKLEDLKVGDYVKFLHSDVIGVVQKINKKSFTTTTGSTIYESEFKHYFVITEEEARASDVHMYNQELKELNENLKSLHILLKIFQQYEVNTEALDNKINGILDNIKEKLENEEINNKNKRLK